MKNVRSKSIYILIILGFFILPRSTAFGRAENNKATNTRARARNVMTATYPSEVPMDINNITSWLRGDGYHDPIVSSSWNGTFPKGTAGFIYAEGVVWGGKVNDGLSPTVRVAGNVYASSCRAGKILTDSAGNVIGREPDDPINNRIFRVRRDWATADLTDDASNFYLEASSAVSDAQRQNIRDQYLVDWITWPVAKGAPYEDRNHNGIYDPDPSGRLQSANGDTLFDIPGFPGADQTLWIVYNDLDAGTAESDYGSPPIGLEVQETDWSYAATNPLGNMIFKKSRIIYKGTVNTPHDATIDSMFIVQWADPDDGQYSDDFAGCDTLLSLGYVYNSSSTDAIYFNQFGLPPPAGGFDFLQGPIVPGAPGDSAIFDLKVRHGFKNLPMTTFTYFAAGSQRSDPDRGGSYSGTLQWYNLMRASEPRPQYPSFTPLYDQNGNVTHYELSGDPVTGAGDLDGKPTVANPNRLPPGDRRIVLSSGPFNMARGDTQEIVTALVGGLGKNYLSSVSVLKYNVGFARFAYNNFFVLPSAPASPKVVVGDLDHTILLNWGTDQVSVNKTENTPQAGFEFEGYNVYQLPSANSQLSDGIRIATFDIKNLVSIIFDNVFDEASGFVVYKPVQFGSNSGIQRYLKVTSDAVRGNVPLVNGQTYYFAVTAYSYNGNLPPSAPFHVLESSPVLVIATPQSNDPGVRYSAKYDSSLASQHIAGLSDGKITGLVVDPSKLTGHTYKITFSGTKDSKTYSITDTTAGTTLFSNLINLGPAFGGAATDYPIIGGTLFSVVDVNYGMNDSKTHWTGTPQWLEGSLRFSADGVTPDPNSVFNGGVLPGESGPTYLGHFGSLFDPKLSPQVDIRFSTTVTQKAYRLMRNAPGGGYAVQTTNGFADVPFTVWDMSNPNSPRQLTAAWRDQDGDGTWNPSVGNDGVEVIFIYDSTYNPSGSRFPVGVADTATVNVDIMYICAFQVTQGHTLSEANGTLSIGVNLRFDSTDAYTLSLPKNDTSSALAKADVERINVFPNPYYGFNNRELTRINKYVTFNHLPSTATIRIFNLAGVLVKIIDHTNQTQFDTWNLRNQSQLPVASGIYIIYIDMPTLNTTKILKLALIQEEQILRVY